MSFFRRTPQTDHDENEHVSSHITRVPEYWEVPTDEELIARHQERFIRLRREVYDLRARVEAIGKGKDPENYREKLQTAINSLRNYEIAQQLALEQFHRDTRQIWNNPQHSGRFFSSRELTEVKAAVAARKTPDHRALLHVLNLANQIREEQMEIQLRGAAAAAQNRRTTTPTTPVGRIGPLFQSVFRPGSSRTPSPSARGDRESGTDIRFVK